jgi:hypothetical protein
MNAILMRANSAATSPSATFAVPLGILFGIPLGVDLRVVQFAA